MNCPSARTPFFEHSLTSTGDGTSDDETTEGRLFMDVEAVERVEAELDAFVERRAREARDANKVEELWAASERRVRERRRRENCSLWYSHHCHLHEVHQALADRHRERAEALLGPGEGAS